MAVFSTALSKEIAAAQLLWKTFREESLGEWRNIKITGMNMIWIIWIIWIMGSSCPILPLQRFSVCLAIRTHVPWPWLTWPGMAQTNVLSTYICSNMHTYVLSNDDMHLSTISNYELWWIIRICNCINISYGTPYIVSCIICHVSYIYIRKEQIESFSLANWPSAFLFLRSSKMARTKMTAQNLRLWW